MFFIEYIDGRKIIKSDLITEVENFFTTRDICIYSKEENMSENKEKVEAYLGQKLVTNHPIHGVDIAKVVEGKSIYNDVDALLLTKGYSGFLNFGDCVPLILYAKGVAIISHAGWRGTAKNMAKISVDRLLKETKCLASDIKVVIGPSICSECYEVGKDVFNALHQTVINDKGIFNIKNNRYFVDLKGINKRQLEEKGVKLIDVCPYCTNCGEKFFYSYRYEKTGYRHSAVVKV